MAKGLYDLQLKTMHGFERLFCDETPMPVLDPGRGRTKVCQFWAHATDDRPWKGPAPPAVAYVFAGGRGKKEIMTHWPASRACCKSTATPPMPRWRAMRRCRARSGWRIASFTRAATS